LKANKHRKFLRPSQLVLIGDQLLMLLGMMSALFAYYRLVDINEFPAHTILYRLSIQLTLGVVAWLIFGVYRKVIRFFSSKDYLNLIMIIVLIHIVALLCGQLFPENHRFRYEPEIYLVSFFMSSIYVIFSRFIISYLYTFYSRSKKIEGQKKLLIYGAGELGVFLKKSILTNNTEEFELVGFLDDDKKKIGRYIGGRRVFDASKALNNIIQKYGVTDVIIANKTISSTRKSAFLQQALECNVRVKEISSIQSLFNSNFNIHKLSNIDINDLMNRKPIELYDKHVVDGIKDKTILVTGAAGSIGSEIVRKLSEHDASLIICVDFSESALYDLEQELKRKHPELNYRFLLIDVRNEKLMENVFEEYRPDFLYHAAAYKHVPLMEQFPWEAVKINVFATWSILHLAVRYNVERFVFVSSDKAVNPTSVMGATKRLAEILVQAFSSANKDTKFVITRFGNVLGSNGSVVPLFKKQIQNGGPVTVTHPEMIRYFMTIAEACQLVLEASIMAEGGEVFVFDMGEPVKIVDLAKNMIRLAGYTPDVDVKIQFIGERPGEKLYEEVFLKDEKMKETHHEKIMISKESVVEMQQALKIIDKLNALSGHFVPEMYRVVLKDLIPEYQSVAGNNKVVNYQTGKKINQYELQNPN
jgi:FlaA1/EpsC-like NDP-sugar epimerase